MGQGLRLDTLEATGTRRDVARESGRRIGIWILERWYDVAMWPLNLVRDLPIRLSRLGGTLSEGVTGAVQAVPEGIEVLSSPDPQRKQQWARAKATNSGFWLLSLITRLFDLAGGPEVAEYVIHIATHTGRLAPGEVNAAGWVLGGQAIRWDDVRVAQGGLLNRIFARNGGRAFATFHTVNLPDAGPGGRSNVSIVVHELTHVRQYERVGSVYIVQALRAQSTEGYGYGGPEGLGEAWAGGKCYRNYNREQQAQIAQDYYLLCQDSTQDREDRLALYEPYITELRTGDL